MKIFNAEIFLSLECTLGEGCIYDYHFNRLYWVDIEGCNFHYYDFNSENHVTKLLNSRPGTIVPINKDQVLLAIEDGIYVYDIIKNEISKRLIETPQFKIDSLRFNDGKCDSKGNFWVGTMHLKAEKNAGKLFAFNNDLIPKFSPTTISNGISWSFDNKTMYYIDTVLSSVLAFDYNMETLEITNERTVININPSHGYPDGMTIDSEGMLWVALWDGYAVGRFNPITGELIAKVNVPAPKITSCAFGGENLDTLFITSARVDMSEEELEKYPLSGSLFSANVGITGVKCNHYKMT